MELKDFNEITSAILSNLGENADQGEISNKLADLTTAFAEEVSNRQKAETESNTLKTKNEKLQADNMKLYLRISQSVENPPATNDGKPSRPEDKTDPIEALYKNGRRDI